MNRRLGRLLRSALFAAPFMLPAAALAQAGAGGAGGAGTGGATGGGATGTMSPGGGATGDGATGSGPTGTGTEATGTGTTGTGATGTGGAEQGTPPRDSEIPSGLDDSSNIRDQSERPDTLDQMREQRDVPGAQDNFPPGGGSPDQ